MVRVNKVKRKSKRRSRRRSSKKRSVSRRRRSSKKRVSKRRSNIRSSKVRRSRKKSQKKVLRRRRQKGGADRLDVASASGGPLMSEGVRRYVSMVANLCVYLVGRNLMTWGDTMIPGISSTLGLIAFGVQISPYIKTMGDSAQTVFTSAESKVMRLRDDIIRRFLTINSATGTWMNITRNRVGAAVSVLAGRHRPDIWIKYIDDGAVLVHREGTGRFVALPGQVTEEGYPVMRWGRPQHHRFAAEEEAAELAQVAAAAAAPAAITPDEEEAIEIILGPAVDIGDDIVEEVKNVILTDIGMLDEAVQSAIREVSRAAEEESTALAKLGPGAKEGAGHKAWGDRMPPGSASQLEPDKFLPRGSSPSPRRRRSSSPSSPRSRRSRSPSSPSSPRSRRSRSRSRSRGSRSPSRERDRI